MPASRCSCSLIGSEWISLNNLETLPSNFTKNSLTAKFFIEFGSATKKLVSKLSSIALCLSCNYLRSLRTVYIFIAIALYTSGPFIQSIFLLFFHFKIFWKNLQSYQKSNQSKINKQSISNWRPQINNER